MKAYSTRVGGGPFPTEQDNATGQYLRDRGNEYGTVTRRPRRCGWLDVVALRYTSRLSGVDSIAVMLLDVLSGLDELKVCTAYSIDGKQSTRFPSHVDDLRNATPVYESLPAGRKKSPIAARTTICRQMPAPICGGSASWSASRSEWFRSDRSANKRSLSARRDGRWLEKSHRRRWILPSNAARGTSRSSWTATAAGPSGRTCRASRAIERGVDSVRRTTEECARLKIEQLTLYCLSSENWKRPQTEINFLMHLLEQYMIEERSTIMDNNVRVRMLGRRDDIPEQVLRELDKTVEMSSANTGLWLNLAINYGGRAELVDAMRSIARRIQAGDLSPEQIDETSNRRQPLHGRRPRSRPVDPHRRRNADQQLPALADQLRRNLGHRKVLARVRRSDAARSNPSLRRATATIRRTEATELPRRRVMIVI